METVPFSKVEFDARLTEIEALIRDWAERECTSFDAAVRPGTGPDEGSIWDMPKIDSKRTTSLLVELEPLVGFKLPCALIKRGGYSNVDELLKNLPPKIRDLCQEVGPTIDATMAPEVAIKPSPP